MFFWKLKSVSIFAVLRFQKNDFRSELAKKLLAGPKVAGLVKVAHSAEDEGDSKEAHDSSSTRIVSTSARETDDSGDADLFKPPANGLFGDDHEEVISFLYFYQIGDLH